MIFHWVFIKQGQDEGTKKPANFVVSSFRAINFLVNAFVHVKFVLQN